jgi:hypothetical protein
MDKFIENVEIKENCIQEKFNFVKLNEDSNLNDINIIEINEKTKLIHSN